MLGLEGQALEGQALEHTLTLGKIEVLSTRARFQAPNDRAALLIIENNYKFGFSIKLLHKA
jgi:hypothetical protein